MRYALKRLEKHYQLRASIFDTLGEPVSWLRENLDLAHRMKLSKGYQEGKDFVVGLLAAPLKEWLDFGVRLLNVTDEFPELLLVFELNHCGKGGRLSKIISDNMSRSMKQEEIEDILDQCGNDCLLLFDGYDEYLKNKKDSGWVAEVDQVIQREALKNFNLIVSTRPWNSEGLLNEERLGFEKVSISQFNKPKRNDFIENFFVQNPPREDANHLINALDSPDCVVPKKIAAAPRMLLYICNIWGNSNKKLKEDILKTKVLFWDQVWELMRRTHNLKYPTEEITQEDLAQTKRKLAEFVEGKKNEEMSYKQYYKWFGDGLDLFYFGVYSIEETETPPWQKESKGDKDGAAVAPTYGVSIQDMLENECEKIGQKKEEARRKEEEKEKKRKEEEEAKKKGWFSWFWQFCCWALKWVSLPFGKNS